MRERSEKANAWSIVAILAVVILAWNLFAHRSDESWFLRYSFPHLVFLVASLGILAFHSIAVLRLWSQAWRILPAIGLPVLLLASILELAVHADAVVRPSYQVVFLQPDRWVGWTQVPNLRWRHDGHFNEAGNETFAQALYEWVIHGTEPGSDIAERRRDDS